MMRERYASPDEVEEWRTQRRLPLTSYGRLIAHEIERRFYEGQSIEQIALDMKIQPWQIQLITTQLYLEEG